MKKIILFATLLIAISWFGSANAQLSVLRGQQGGTGVSSTIAGNTGSCLKVNSVSPLTWTIDSCSTGSVTSITAGSNILITGATSTPTIAVTSTPAFTYIYGQTGINISLSSSGVGHGLLNSAGINVVPWNSLLLRDSTDKTSLDWGNRYLSDSVEVQAINYSTAGTIAFPAYSSNELLKTTSGDGTIAVASDGNDYWSPASLTALSQLSNDVPFLTGANQFWKQSGTSLYPSSTSWNVGIGTTAPGKKLDVAGGILASSTDYSHFVRSGSGAAVYINQSSVSFPAFRVSTGSAAANQNVVFTIEGDGNVGIGTTTPQYALDAYTGTVRATNLRADGSGSPNIELRTTGGTPFIDFTATSTAVNTPDYDFRIINNSSNLALVPLSATGIYLTPTGNVGVGTSTPSVRLQLHDSANNPGLELSGTPVANFTGVGFGPNVTTQTVARMSQSSLANGGMSFFGFTSSTNVVSALSFTGHLGSTSPTLSAIAFSGWKHNGTTGRTALTGSEPVARFLSGSTELLRITGNGNVGIGTTTPAYILHVVNSTATTSIAVGSTASGANRGNICQWNGASYTITNFAANSIVPVYSTSTICQ